ncbi:MAG: PrsW family intramembrane metalloprotease [Anaerofustis stercorihominis]|nr:PrsW family intramembrane metalloprotease [Anaerofustis stercorihominis]
MSMNMTLVEDLLIAVLPTFILLMVIKQHDMNEKEPTGLLVKLFIMGMLSVIPAIILESMVYLPTYTYFQVFMYAFIGVALIEEGVKLFMAKIALKRATSFDEVYDGIIYCVYVSLGFATVENVMYVLQFGTSTGIVRAVTAVPAHAVFAISMGYFMGLVKSGRGGPVGRFLIWFAPTLLHAVYDFILFTNLDWSLIVFIPYIAWIYSKAIDMIRETYDMEPFE